MKILLPLCIAMLALASCQPSESDVSGQVFIVTKGGQNYKLGLVEVKVIPEDPLKPYIQSKLDTAKRQLADLAPITKNLKREYDQASEERDSIYQLYLEHILSDSYEKRYDKAKDVVEDKMQSYLTSLRKLGSYIDAPFFFDDLPRSIQKGKTDADGKFSFKLKPGRYAIVASASRQVVDDTEKYYWIVWLTVASGQENKVTLSNDNLFDTSCSECVVKQKELLNQVDLSSSQL